MTDELACRASSWLQALWAQRAVDALAEAGALPVPAAEGRGTKDESPAPGAITATELAALRAQSRRPPDQGAQQVVRARLQLAQAQAMRTRLARIDGGDALSEACEALGDVLSMASLRNGRRNGIASVLDTVRHPVLLTDGERWCLDANAAATRLLGTSRTDVALHRLDDFAPHRWRRTLAERWAILERAPTHSGALLLLAAEGHEVTAGYTAAVNLAADRHLIVIERIDGLRFGPWAASMGARRGSTVLRPREREVLALVAAGRTSAGIALHLEVSRNTVESHIRNAVVRLGASNRTHAVVTALSLGEIALPVAQPRSES